MARPQPGWVSVRGRDRAYALGSGSGSGEPVARALERLPDLILADLVIVVVDLRALPVKAHLETPNAGQLVLEPLQCHHARRAVHALDAEHFLCHLCLL